VYLYDQEAAQLNGFSNTATPKEYSYGSLPKSSQTVWTEGEYVSVENYIKLNTEGQSDGAFRQWYQGQLSFERDNVKLLGDGQAEALQSFTFTFWTGGPDSDPKWRNPPQDQSMYVRRFVLSAAPISH
jgi:hypothetical protein